MLQRRHFVPLTFLLPTILILLVMQVYPAFYAIYLSFTRLRRGEAEYVGLRNYERLFQLPSFFEAIQHTLVYVVFYVTLTLFLGLGLALLLNQRIRFRGVYLVLIFLPWVLSDVVTGTMWRWLSQPSYGLLQTWLIENTLIKSTLYTDPAGAMAIVIAASVWRGLAFSTLLSLGALQTIPHEITESTAIDGANRLQRFVFVTFPLIRPTLLVMLLLLSIRAINAAGLIFTTTGGGPGRATQTLSVLLLITGWQQGNFGQGAAISVLILLVNIVLTLLYLRLILKRRNM